MPESNQWKLVWYKRTKRSAVLMMVCPDCGVVLPYRQPYRFDFCPCCGNPKTYPSIGGMAAEIVKEE